jgi:hypothetical protein
MSGPRRGQIVIDEQSSVPPTPHAAPKRIWTE